MCAVYICYFFRQFPSWFSFFSFYTVSYYQIGWTCSQSSSSLIGPSPLLSSCLIIMTCRKRKWDKLNYNFISFNNLLFRFTENNRPGQRGVAWKCWIRQFMAKPSFTSTRVMGFLLGTCSLTNVKGFETAVQGTWKSAVLAQFWIIKSHVWSSALCRF